MTLLAKLEWVCLELPAQTGVLLNHLIKIQKLEIFLGYQYLAPNPANHYDFDWGMIQAKVDFRAGEMISQLNRIPMGIELPTLLPEPPMKSFHNL